MGQTSQPLRKVWRQTVAIFAVIGLLTATVPTEGLAQDAMPTIAEATPASTVAFLWFDLDRESSQWQQTDELLARVGMPNALDQWEESILDQGEQSGDITASELDALLGGEMAVVILPPAVERIVQFVEGLGSGAMMHAMTATPAADAAAEPSGIVAILRPSDPETAWSYVERQFADLAAELGLQVQEGAYGDADVISIPPASPSGSSEMHEDDGSADSGHRMDHHGMGGFRGLAAARSGEFFVTGRSEADLAEIIDVIEGSADSLADSEEARAVLAELPAEALTFGYVNGQGFLDALDPETIAELESAMQGMPVEALASQAGMTISAEASGFRYDDVTMLNEAVDVDALTVENDPAVAEAAALAPAGTFAFQAGLLPENAFAGAAYSAAQAVNAAVSGAPRHAGMGEMELPTEEQIAEEIATASAALGFDLQADLFGLLGNEVIAFTSLPSITREGFSIDAVAAISTTDPEALAETMARFGAWLQRSEIGFDVAVQSIDGTQVLVATNQNALEAPALEFGVVGDAAVFGLGEGIDTLMNPPADSLANDEPYQTVMGLLPDAYYQVAFVDLGQVVDPIMNLKGGLQVLQALQSGSADAMMNESAEAGSPRNIRAIGAVAFQEDNISGTSAILYIGG
jgi:hypothetical protein